MMNVNRMVESMNALRTKLAEYGFIEGDHGKIEYAQGSISNYTKCAVFLSSVVYGDIANEYFYSVRFESFAESGQPEIDHHTVTESYMTIAQIGEFLKGKGILTKAEREARREEFRIRLEKIRMQRERG